eukprot:scaffold27586_cov101-Isochrysis_galbana.AAC.1
MTPFLCLLSSPSPPPPPLSAISSFTAGRCIAAPAHSQPGVPRYTVYRDIPRGGGGQIVYRRGRPCRQ